MLKLLAYSDVYSMTMRDEMAFFQSSKAVNFEVVLDPFRSAHTWNTLGNHQPWELSTVYLLDSWPFHVKVPHRPTRLSVACRLYRFVNLGTCLIIQFQTSPAQILWYHHKYTLFQEVLRTVRWPAVKDSYARARRQPFQFWRHYQTVFNRRLLPRP